MWLLDIILCQLCYDASFKYFSQIIIHLQIDIIIEENQHNQHLWICKWTLFVQTLPLETMKVCMKEKIGSLDKCTPSPNVTNSNSSCIPPLKQKHIYLQINVNLTVSLLLTHFNMSLVWTNSPPSLITVLLKIIMDIVLLFQNQETLSCKPQKVF